MAQIKLKQIKGLTPGSILFLNQNSTVIEDFSRLNWNTTQNQLTIGGNITLTDSHQVSNTITATGLSTGTAEIYGFDSNLGTAAYFEYVIYETASKAMRSGLVMCVWDVTTGEISMTDSATKDINATTDNFTFEIVISGSELSLQSVIESGTWEVKIFTRII